MFSSISIVSRIVRKLLAEVFSEEPKVVHPEHFALREWADLPPYHPPSDDRPASGR